jgi:hypothetical protein
MILLIISHIFSRIRENAGSFVPCYALTTLYVKKKCMSRHC